MFLSKHCGCVHLRELQSTALTGDVQAQRWDPSLFNERLLHGQTEPAYYWTEEK